MTSLESWLLSFLVNSLWQIPLLLAVGWLAARLLRPAGPAAEHRAWVAILLMESLLPAASTLPWQRLTGLLTAAPHASPQGRVSIVMGPGVAVSAGNLPSALLAAIAIVYALVVTWFAARFLWRCLHLRAIRREAIELSLTGEAASFWSRCSRHFGVAGVSAAASPHVFGPVTMGIFRPLVVFPAGMLGSLTESDLRTVIAHEFAHLRRHDFLKNLVYEAVSLPVAWNPLVWITRHRVTETREMVCDQMAAEDGARTDYARSLLRLASLLVQGRPPALPHAIGIFDTQTFERRIMSLTEKRKELRGLRRLAVVAACGALGFATCGSALALALHVDAAAAEAKPAVSVPAHVMAGNRISGPMPKYPEAAKKHHIQGQVVLHATISRQGNIEHLTVVSGPKELRSSAYDAVHQWKYKPYLLKGKPVAVTTTINVVYSLGN